MTLSSRTRVVKSLQACAVAALLAAVLPAVAGATDYCVDTSCGGTDAQSLEEAILLADNDGEPDRIFLGAEKYTAPTANGYNYSAADRVEIIGQGIGQTILTGPPGAFTVLNLFGGPDSSVQDLTIRLPESVAYGVRGLSTQNAARRIEVVEDGAQANQRTGISLRRFRGKACCSSRDEHVTPPLRRTGGSSW